ncbi:hypothetical protein ACN27J_33095 [Solwaraspora sp. WMMB762]|uniref:hypothetical protein n=1 Tax=Solwaraspora sp. WMMB762 TaxID=3404120 RepID=UPI003B9583C9
MTRAEHRLAAYDAKLQRPPECRVLSHHTPLPGSLRSPFMPMSGRWPENVVFVWLREDDGLLRQWLERPTSEFTFDRLASDRAAIDQYAQAAAEPERIITVDTRQTRDTTARWQQVLESVSTALSQMVERGLLTTDLTAVQEKAELDDPAVAGPLLRWLRADACAAVPEVAGPHAFRS